MDQGHLIKRSVTLNGHRTSVALEAPFWDVIDAEAMRRDVPLARLVAAIDADRGAVPLASALRVLALNAVRSHRDQSPSGAPRTRS